MRSGIIATMKTAFVRFLFPMIWEGLPRNLSSGKATAISEGCQKEGVHGSPILKDVENLLDTLIHERNGADLHANRFG